MRRVIEDWVQTYPESDRAALVSRLRSPIDFAHLSAFFELALYQLLLANGARVLAVEPEVPGSNKRPDFLVESSTGQIFFLEAVTVTGISQDDIARNNLKASVLDALNAVSCPNHFLQLDISSAPISPIGLRKLTNKVQAWIHNIDGECRPLIHEENGLLLEVVAVPSSKPRKPGDRAIGIEMGTLSVSTPGDGIREAVKSKASRYGTLPHPLVVAVNSLRLIDDYRDFVAALYGSDQLVIRQFRDGRREEFWARKPDGVWTEGGRSRREGLHAVLGFSNLYPWSWRDKTGTMILNAYLPQPVQVPSLRCETFVPEDDHLTRSAGEALGQIITHPSGSQ